MKELAGLVVVLAASSCGHGPTEGGARKERVDRPSESVRSEPILPLEALADLDPRRVELGGHLFHDERLSKDGSIACASCHQVAAGGDDGLARSPGVGGALGGINTPTVLNSGHSIAQFWNGRAKTLEAQAGGPLTAPAEMAATWASALATIKADRDYVRWYTEAFPDGITEANTRSALAEFERSLVTLDSPFDRWLRGADDALTEGELEGYRLFKSVGCVACHQGRNVGGNMFQKFGIAANFMEDRGGLTDADLGRFALTKDPADRFVFKVPSLRNIAQTAPYLHDGSIPDLAGAVAVMGRYQLGRDLSPKEIDLLVRFLETLTGRIPDVTRFQAWAKARNKRGA